MTVLAFVERFTPNEIFTSAAKKSAFLKWSLVNALYLIIVAVAALSYKGHVHQIGLIAIAAVLALYAATSAYAGWLCWDSTRIWGNGDHRDTHHISLAIELAPKLAMLGTVGGFLIAFGSSAGDVQHRVLGASTGLAATFVGISVMIVLEILRHLIETEK